MVEDMLQVFFDKLHELTTEKGCLMLQTTVVILKCTNRKWSCGLDKGIGTFTCVVASCWQGHWGWCPMLWRMPDDEGRPQTNLSTHLEFPDSPRRRIHVDFCRTIPGESFLVFVYAYLKWPEVVAMDETTTDTTVDDLRALFARWGIPLQMVTDNGPNSGFERFLALNSIQHNKCSPYHPATNVFCSNI